MKAKEFNVKHWIDANGQKIDPIKLSDFKGKFKVIFCFQSWCPGCHSSGFPSLQKLTTALADSDIVFLAIQTVFEGFEANTYDKIIELQKQYDLKIPFGHDAGSDDKSTSNFMQNYETGGTPYFLLIDKKDKIVFSDFNIHVDDRTIAYLKGVSSL